jgi:hypothetical protein
VTETHNTCTHIKTYDGLSYTSRESSLELIELSSISSIKLVYSLVVHRQQYLINFLLCCQERTSEDSQETESFQQLLSARIQEFVEEVYFT